MLRCSRLRGQIENPHDLYGWWIYSRRQNSRLVLPFFALVCVHKSVMYVPMPSLSLYLICALLPCLEHVYRQLFLITTIVSHATEGPKFPVFVHPTPINISIRPLQAQKPPSAFMTSIAAATNSSGAMPILNGSSDPRFGTQDQVCATGTGPRRGNYQNSTATTSTSGMGGGCCLINWFEFLVLFS